MENQQIINELCKEVGELKGVVKTGFRNVNSRLDKMNGSADKREKRINKLESDNDQRKGVIATVSGVTSVVVTIIFFIADYFLKKLTGK